MSGHPCYCRQHSDRWPAAFRQRCAGKLEHLGVVATNTQQHDDAVHRYSAALSLDLLIPQLGIKRSKAHLAKGFGEDAPPVRGPYLAWVILIDAKSLGDSASIISVAPRAGVDGMGEGLTNGLWKGALDAAHEVRIFPLTFT